MALWLRLKPCGRVCESDALRLQNYEAECEAGSEAKPKALKLSGSEALNTRICVNPGGSEADSARIRDIVYS